MARKDLVAVVSKIKILVACEFSGRVRQAFRERGFDAWSCDLLPADDGSPHHIQDDVLSHLDEGWQLMIGHPSCTFLCNSGVRWLYGGKGKVVDQKRWKNMQEGAEFFLKLWNAPVPRICLENPIMHSHAKEIIGMEQSQVVQPWWFNDPVSKATCLWLKNLPPLKATHAKPEVIRKDIHMASPGPDRWKIRSTTFPGIAQAFAEQWSELLLTEKARTA